MAAAAVALAAALGTTLTLRHTTSFVPANTRLPSLLVNAGPRGASRWQVRPAGILFTGDGSGRLVGAGGTEVAHPGHVTWRSWTETLALGSGLIWSTNNFSRTIAKVSATARAFRPVDGHFTRLTLRSTYDGTTDVVTLRIQRDGHYWQYAPPAER